jgi:hypothetical protein
MQLRVLSALVFCLTGFILSILILFSGSKPGFLEDGALSGVIFQNLDLNYFVLMLSKSSNEKPSYSAIIAFQQSHDSEETPDWISVYYLTTCWGNYTDSGAKANTTCDKLSNHPSLVDKAFISWTIGTAIAGFVSLILPFFLRGRLRWNGVVFALLLVSDQTLYASQLKLNRIL